jgi:hypothetical protein
LGSFFTHLDAFENLAFGLRRRHASTGWVLDTP